MVSFENTVSFIPIGWRVSKWARPEGISGAANGARTVAPMRSGFGRELRLAVYQLPSKFKQNPRWGSLAVVFRRLQVISLQSAVWSMQFAVYAAFVVFSAPAISAIYNKLPALCSQQFVVWSLFMAADLNSCRLEFAVYKLVTESAPTVDITCVIAPLIWFKIKHLMQNA